MQKKKKILIVYTGGTIGMLSTENGYEPDLQTFHKSLREIPELKHPDMPQWDLIDFDPLLDSSDISVNEWNLIGKKIFDNYSQYDGFVVLHGTDTMAYSASALSFMLENLNKPVIFTGAQIPLCELRSDGRDNLITAVSLAASNKIHEVCLYFHGSLLRGCRSTKLSSEDFSAFKSPNTETLAEAGIRIIFNEKQLLAANSGTLHLQELKKNPIGVLKIFPGIQFELFAPIMTENLKGVVLETFGSGNIPSHENELIPLIEKAYKNGTVIAVCSQCVQGGVSLGTYAASRPLKNIGAVDCKDMTTEAAVTKLYYLLSKDFDKETVSRMMGENLRGEMSDCLL